MGNLAQAARRAGAFRRPRWLAVALLLLVPSSVAGQFSAANQYSPRQADNIASVAFHRPPQALLAEHRRLAEALSALRPQRAGTVDAYVIVAALDSDPVFGREARETAQVLGRRFDAAGRTILLAAGEGGGPAGLPGSPENLTLALARVAELADPREDAVILYTTSHGSAEQGLAYRDRERGTGAISPARLAAILDGLGIRNRLVMLSACYSGIFLPRLASDTSVVMSAAAADRSSFGCNPGNDWTFFGDALVNRALRKPQPLATAFAEARRLVSAWEKQDQLLPSNPQISIGKDAQRWLGPIEKRMPKEATAPVGRSPSGG